VEKREERRRWKRLVERVIRGLGESGLGEWDGSGLQLWSYDGGRLVADFSLNGFTTYETRDPDTISRVWHAHGRRSGSSEKPTRRDRRHRNVGLVRLYVAEPLSCSWDGPGKWVP
jgi:hypothetical protein